MSTDITEHKDGWFVLIDGEKSGPWKTESVAEAAERGDFIKANFLHNKATSCESRVGP